MPVTLIMISVICKAMQLFSYNSGRKCLQNEQYKSKYRTLWKSTAKLKFIFIAVIYIRGIKWFSHDNWHVDEVETTLFTIFSTN